MEPWIYIASATGLFALFFLVMNTYQFTTKRSAYDRPMLFGPIFSSFIAVPFVVFAELQELIWLPGLLIMLVMTGLSGWLGDIWSKRVAYTKSVDYEAYPFILKQTRTSAVMKCLDITIQQLCAYLILLGLYGFGWLQWQIILGFVLVVFLLHLPSERFFGKTFGRYFLVVSTALAFVIPVLLAIDVRFIYLTFTLHVIGYWVLFWLVYRYTIPR